MCKLLSIAALVAGIWLLYMGHERQESIAGKAADSLSRIGQKVDGGDHMTDQTKYYIAGAVLLAAGALGLGVVRK